MSGKIETLEQVLEVLEAQGYKAQMIPGGAVAVEIGGAQEPFTAVITQTEDGAELVVTCQLAVLGDMDEELSAQFMLAALDANTALRPYAFAVISDTDDAELEDADQWPVVLTSSVPIGDLSEGELCVAMDGLWRALSVAGPVLKLGLSK